MKTNTKRLLATTLGITFGVNFIAFAYYYAFAMIFSVYEPIYYVMPALFDLVVMLTPIITAAFMLLCGAKVWQALLLGILPSLSRVVYSVPMYYLQFVLYEDYDSIEAFLYGLFPTFLWVLLSYALSVIGYLLLLAFTAKIRAINKDNPYAFCGYLSLDDPLSRGFAVLALLGFAYEFIYQLVLTLSYLLENAGDYRLDDIAYMLTYYIFTLALFFILYLLPEFLRKKFTFSNASEIK